MWGMVYGWDDTTIQPHWALPVSNFGLPVKPVQEQAISWVRDLPLPRSWDCGNKTAFTGKHSARIYARMYDHELF
jgi:hypothetical protein